MRSSLFQFLPRAPLLIHHDRVILGRTVYLFKGKGGATAYFQHIAGGATEGTTFLLKGRSVVGFSYVNLMYGPIFFLHNLELRETLKFGILSHADDEI